MEQESRLRTIKSRIEQNSEVLNRLVDNIVRKYDKELDEFLEQTRDTLRQSDRLSDSELEQLVMKIPIFMYFTGNGLETLGIESDMAKQVKMQVYHDKYMLAEGTIKDKEAEASLETLNEQLMETAFQRAYKKLKLKLDMAEHVFSGAKKVLSKRMQEFEMSQRDK